jgi:hypothetical protein
MAAVNPNQVWRGSGNPQHDLNHMAPAARTVNLGDRLNDLITNYNLLQAQHAALLAALVAANGAVLPSLAAVSALTTPATIKTLITAAQGANQVG